MGDNIVSALLIFLELVFSLTLSFFLIFTYTLFKSFTFLSVGAETVREGLSQGGASVSVYRRRRG